MRLYDLQGQRKYVTPAERKAFLQAAEGATEEVRTFCGTLVYSGCRISEALALTAARVDIGDGVLVIESLKKRRYGIYRAVPVPLPCSMTSGPGVGLGVPLNLVQKWLGHAQLTTIGIYVEAVGSGERDIAQDVEMTVAAA